MTAPYHNKALPEGALLREWRLERVLGVGGFGIVYRGRGLYFDEIVAIKEYFPGAISDRRGETTVAPNDSSSEEVYNLGLSKFVEEAKILWNLSKPDRHPNIVAVRSLFQINGTAYMVMDFESGVSLSQMLKDGRKFSEADLSAIIRPIALGLDRAHRAGVLHRDIKPANILIDDEGRPVLIDFGSARFESNQATSTKVTFYTPPYAAIEQYVKTYPQGPWTDIYALGVTLFECVAGKKPPEVLERLHGGADEPFGAQARPGFSPTFIRAVEAAMAINPADRPQSIPQWLRMFDEDASTDETDEEVTRVAVRRDAPEPVPAASPKPAPEPTPAAALAATPSPIERDLAPPSVAAPSRRRARSLAVPPLLAAAAIAVVLGGLGAVLLRPKAAPQASPAVAASPATDVGQGAAAPGDSAAAVPSEVAAALDGLVSDARRAGRPSREIAALNAGADKVSALLSATPPDPAAADRAAKEAARAQGAALGRDAAARLRDVQSNPAWLSAATKGPRARLGTAQAARQAKAALDRSIAAIARAGDGGSAIDAARRAVSDHQGFVAALAAAQPAFTGARRDQITALEGSVRHAAAEVARLAAGPKPGMFASKSEKRGYRTAQDNAARARARLAELERYAQAGRAATDLAVIDSTIQTLTSGAAELEALKAATAAALSREKAAEPAQPTEPAEPPKPG